MQFNWTYKWEISRKLILKIVHITFSVTWSILKILIRAYEKDFMKIRFESDDNLPFDKIIKLHVLTVIIRSIFEEGDQYVFWDECLDEV